MRGPHKIIPQLARRHLPLAIWQNLSYNKHRLKSAVMRSRKISPVDPSDTWVETKLRYPRTAFSRRSIRSNFSQHQQEFLKPMPDMNLTCRDCGTSFQFTEGEQDFYSTKGYSQPTRCPS